MARDYPKAPERGPYDFEEEETFVAERCIRIFERVMDAVNETPEAEISYTDLFSLYADILEDEFKGYAFTLAYHLYSRDKIIMRDRAERYLADEEAQGFKHKERRKGRSDS
jgi:hypothetical protein